jgi:hypothetical protein
VGSGAPSAPIDVSVRAPTSIHVAVEAPNAGQEYVIDVTNASSYTAIAPDAGGLDSVGPAVARDGDTLVVGGGGVVHVFRLIGAAWQLEARLQPPDDASRPLGFGASVALSGDTLAVGSPQDISSGNPVPSSAPWPGAVYVFTRSGTMWTEEAYLTASNAPAWQNLFGSSLALRGDTLAIGAQQEPIPADGGPDASLPYAGAAYVFTRSGATWTQAAQLSASNATAYAEFGASVALGSDTLVIGASGAGAAYVFTGSGATWAAAGSLTASNASNAGGFGASLALDGDALAVGAPYEASNATGVGGNQGDTSAPGAGAAYVFRRTQGTFVQEAYVKASNTRQDARFGSAVALSGSTLAVGAILESGGDVGINGDQASTTTPDDGAVYTFLRGTATWAQTAYVKPPVNLSRPPSFGLSLALTGASLLVGEYGRAYVIE